MSSRIEQATGKRVFKIVSAEAWRSAVADGTYRGSGDDRRDGYIHLSAAPQVAATYQKYFENQRDLLLVAFEAAALGPQLKWEVSRGGEHFPHYYGVLQTAMACFEAPISAGLPGLQALLEDQ